MHLRKPGFSGGHRKGLQCPGGRRGHPGLPAPDRTHPDHCLLQVQQGLPAGGFQANRILIPAPSPKAFGEGWGEVERTIP